MISLLKSAVAAAAFLSPLSAMAFTNCLEVMNARDAWEQALQARDSYDPWPEIAAAEVDLGVCLQTAGGSTGPSMDCWDSYYKRYDDAMGKYYELSDAAMLAEMNFQTTLLAAEAEGYVCY